MKLIKLIVAAAVSLPSSTAWAITLEGNYFFGLSTICQAKLTLLKRPDSGNVTGINSDGGSIEDYIGRAVFSGSEVTITARGVEGDMLIITNNRGGVRVHERSLAVTWSYSVTNTTITLNGQEYRADYIMDGQIADQVNFFRRDGNCIERGTAVRKQ